MFVKLKKNISVKKIASFLKVAYFGKDFKVNTFSSLNNPKNNSVCFFTKILNANYNLLDNASYDLKRLKKYKIVVITDKISAKNIKLPKIVTNNPRIDFQRVINNFFIDEQFKKGIHKSAVVEKKSKIGKNVYIGANSYIGDDVVIGEGTKILQNVVVLGKTTLGRNCRIKSNTSIGGEGFSFAYNKNKFIHFSHTGEIVIGNDVWIGSNSTIEKSTIDKTIISNDVKIDDLVHIGHNSFLGKATQVTVGSIICGRAKVGEKCWIAPNSVIDNGIIIGNNCLVGTGSLVRKNFGNNCVIVGSPAKVLRKFKK